MTAKKSAAWLLLLVLGPGFLAPAEAAADKKFKGRKVSFPIQTARPGEIKLSLQIKVPEEHKFTPEAETGFKIISQNSAVAKPLQEKQVRDFSQNAGPVEFQLETNPGQTGLQIETVIYHCTKDAKRCFFEPLKLDVPVKIENNGPKTIAVSFQVESRPLKLR